MNRQALVSRLLPAVARDAGHDLAPLPHATLFATSRTQAGYFLLTDATGAPAPLTLDTLADVLAEARAHGVRLSGLRVFGARKDVSAPGLRFYPVNAAG